MLLALSDCVQNPPPRPPAIAAAPDGSDSPGWITLRLPRKKLLRWNSEYSLAMIDSAVYRVSEFPAENGRGFRFRQIAGGISNVFIANGQEALENDCDCMGHESHGHCKHVDAAIGIMNLATCES